MSERVLRVWIGAGGTLLLAAGLLSRDPSDDSAASGGKKEVVVIDRTDDIVSLGAASGGTIEGQEHSDNYARIGLHDSTAGVSCRTQRCEGSLDSLPSTTSLNDRNLVLYLQRTPLQRYHAQPVSRPIREGERGRALLSVVSLPSARRIALRDLTDGRAQVVAVLVVGQNSAIDAQYGLGTAVARGMSDRFYIIAHDYDVSDPSEPPETAGPIRYSRKVARWSLYGIRGPQSASPTLEKLPASGTLRWCRHRHSVTNRAMWAGFIPCTAQDATAAISNDLEAMALLDGVVRGNRAVVEGFTRGELGWVFNATNAWADANALMSGELAETGTAAARTLAHLWQLQSASLAWFTCGVGCCIADVDPF